MKKRKIGIYSEVQWKQTKFFTAILELVTG